MTKELLSLSLTDIKFNSNSDMNTSDMIKMIIQEGGSFEYTNATNLIIAVATFVIAIVILLGENNWTMTVGRITYLNCSISNCSMGVEYIVDGITYNNEFIVPLNQNYMVKNQIDIKYENSNPNNSRIDTTNYNTYIYILFGISIFFTCIWMLSHRNSGDDDTYIPSLNFSSKTDSENLLYKKI